MHTEYDREIIATEKRRDRLDRLGRTGIPMKYWDATWADYKPREANVPDLATWLGKYAEGFPVKPYMHGGKGLLLQGAPGVGKTMAACILGVELSDSGHYVRFMPLAGYLDALIRQFTLMKAWERYNDDDAHAEWKYRDEEMRRLRDVAHLVILDDVGKEHHTASKYAIDTFDLFLRHRVAIARPVVMTSNIAHTKWTEKYSEAMGSFVHEAATVIGIENDTDLRQA